MISSLSLSKTHVSGAVASAFTSVSIAIIVLGIFTYIRKIEPLKTWLVPYVPTAQYGGIFLYSHIIWAILWIGLFFALRKRQDAGSLRIWLIVFLVSLGIGTGFVEASLNWSQLPTVMQLGSSVSTHNPTQTTGEVSVKILEGSSVQGNLAYAPSTISTSKNNMITWINDDVAPHTVTSGIGMDDPQSGKIFDSGSLGRGQKFSMPAKYLGTGGSYDYYCVIHPFMKGTIIIQ